MRVGLLEDDASILEMLSLVLQEEGYTVIPFSDAEKCLKALGIWETEIASLPVDLIILDWRLTGTISGTDVIHQIRQQPKLDTLPIILTTAAVVNNPDELQKLNVSLLEKPFAVDDVLSLVKTLTQPHSTT